jgi:uncharacterized membrane protein
MNANPLSTVGLMLTLAGLVGSFFNIQLSQWLRDLLALAQKAQLNKAGANEAQQRAIVECRIELERLFNTETYVVNGVVILFVIFVLCDGLAMIRAAQTDPLYPNVRLALWVFLGLFVGLSVWLSVRGTVIARRAAELLKRKA